VGSAAGISTDSATTLAVFGAGSALPTAYALKSVKQSDMAPDTTPDTTSSVEERIVKVRQLEASGAIDAAQASQRINEILDEI
jgi:hypothetical protein